MFIVKLTLVKTLSPSTKAFRFVRVDGDGLEYRPGQFYRFTFADEDGDFERSYSLCNVEDLYGPNLDLLISAVQGGRATRYLFSAMEGVEAKVTGPYGRLVLPSELPGRLVMVGTSAGIAPYMPMLCVLEESLASGKLEVVFLFGARERDEFLYPELFLDYRARFPGFDFRICYSREDETIGAHERLGYVTGQLSSINPDPDRDHYLLCGNPGMIDDVWGVLKKLGFRHKQVVREKYEFARRVQKKDVALTESQRKLIADKLAKYGRS